MRSLKECQNDENKLFVSIIFIVLLLAAPETSRMIMEYEKVQCTNKLKSTAHHEEAPTLQVKFLTDVRNVISVIEEKGNVFLDKGGNLKCIDSRDVMELEVLHSMRNMKSISKDQHDALVTNRLRYSTVPLSDVIHKNSFYTLSNRPDPKHSKPDPLKALRSSSLLASQMFLAIRNMPNADKHLRDFMCHENARDPPSLSDRGLLRSGNKADILDCIQAPKGTHMGVKESTVIILDMSAIIHMIPPTRASTFKEYNKLHVIPYTKGISPAAVTRLDAIYDRYPREYPGYIKGQAHARRGKSGVRTEIGDDGETPIPRHDWKKYISNTDNKEELSAFISKEFTSSDVFGDILVLSTIEDTVLTNRQYDTSHIQPNNHIEADTHIFLHLADAVRVGHTKAFIRTVDSDIVVLSIAFYYEMTNMTHLWIGFATGKYYRDIPIHDICQRLGKDRSRALLFFHAISGCDTVSQPATVGKKTAWDRWLSMPEMTGVYLGLLEDPMSFTRESEAMASLERMAVICYSKSCSASTLDDARLQLFSSGTKTLDTLPPTSAAFYQHARRSILQACYFWKQSLVPRQVIPDYGDWGWKFNDTVGTFLDYLTGCQ